jgi:hypothetical protein
MTITPRPINRRRLSIALLLASLATTSLLAATQAFNEYQLKAVFLFRFAQFVEWPAAKTGPFTICVLGQDPFDAYLEETVRDERIGEQSVTVRQLRSPAELRDCRIVYIHRTEAPRLSAMLEALRGIDVLTVSDAFGFAEQGGMIELVTSDNRIRLKINVEAARNVKLSISSKLLRPATIVATGTTP